MTHARRARSVGRWVGRLALAAALAWGAVLAAGPARLRGPAARTLLAILRRWDRVHLGLDPHPEFTRAPEPADARPLRLQAGEMLEDLRRRFLLHDGRLFSIITPPVELGDACLWQGVYAAAAAWHFELDPSAENRRRAEAALEGLGLLAGRGRPIARAVFPDDIPAEPGGRWYFRAGGWQWKEDASIDSASGWVFGCLVALELLPARREDILELLERFADTVAEGGWVLRNSDGRPTRFCSLGGRVLNSTSGLLSTLAVLKTLDRHGRGERFRQAHDAFIEEGLHRWAAYASGPFLSRNMSTNHNIGHLALASALLAENDSRRWLIYARGAAHLDRLTGKMGNSFWVYLLRWAFARRPELATTAAADPEVAAYLDGLGRRSAAAKVPLREWRYPFSKLKRRADNSRRPGVPMVRWPVTFRKLPAQPLPIWQRPPADFVWQRSAYAMDDFTDYRRRPPQAFAPLDFLAAYWLGRLTGAIGARE